MDKIIIRELEVFYRVGVPDAERRAPQRLLLCLELECDFAAATRADDLSGTIDYYQVTRRLLALGEGREWRLIETLAEDIAGLVLRDFRPAAVTVQVQKFILPETRYVAVEIRRTRLAEAASNPAPAA